LRVGGYRVVRGVVSENESDVKAWLDDELVFDEVLKQINN
jgi:hypothetical protein